LQHDGSKSGFTNLQVNGPYKIAWRWHPVLLDPAKASISVSGKVQPVIANGLACVGFYDGVMYCINQSTGQLTMQYATDGPITNTAGFSGTTLIFGSTDSNIYAVDTTSGNLIWKFPTNSSVQTAPCIVGNRVYMGSSDGSMYAIDIPTGNLAWKYDTTPTRPILTSAACTDTRVYFGDESVNAYSLDATNSGALKWKKQLYGQSMYPYWPVVSEANNVVIFRTQTQRSHGESNFFGDQLVNEPPEKTPENLAAEASTIKNFLDTNLAFKTFWALDTTSGQEKYTAPILYTSGEGSSASPPVVDWQRNIAYVVWRTNYSTFGYWQPRPGVDLGKMDLATGNITSFTGPRNSQYPLHLMSDELAMLSSMQNGLVQYGAGSVVGINLTTETNFPIVNSYRDGEETYYNGAFGPYANDPAAGWPKGRIYGGGGISGAFGAAPAIGNNQIVTIAEFGLLVGLTTQ
jgi:outer membrane protein assembly factor BamB